VSGLDCEAGNCLPGSGSVWFLIVVWAAVAVLAVMWGVVYWRERQEERTGRRPAHRPVRGPELRSAVSVEEIQRAVLLRRAGEPDGAGRLLRVAPLCRPDHDSQLRADETGSAWPQGSPVCLAQAGKFAARTTTA
jgi:hypothetical protein